MSGEATTGITMVQLQEILAAQAAMTKDIVAEAVKAAKEPTADEAEKKAELKRRAEVSRKQALQQQAAEENAKQQRYRNCDHKKENGKWATGGQVIAGKYAVLVCQHCQKPWYNQFSSEVTSQLLAGDVTLFQASPEGWSDKMPWSVEATA